MFFYEGSKRVLGLWACILAHRRVLIGETSPVGSTAGPMRWLRPRDLRSCIRNSADKLPRKRPRGKSRGVKYRGPEQFFTVFRRANGDNDLCQIPALIIKAPISAYIAVVARELEGCCNASNAGKG